MADPRNVIDLIPKELLGKVYDDALAGPFKEIGKLGTDTLRAARLITAPIQLIATFQGRLERMLRRMEERVSEEHLIEAPAEIIAPALEHMRILEDRSELWETYEELITQSIDATKQASVHPAFVHLIKQLSSDEIRLLRHLYSSSRLFIHRLTLNAAATQFSDKTTERTDIDMTVIHLKEQFNFYIVHLTSLGIVEWPITKQEPILAEQGNQTGLRQTSILGLTEFGRLFMSACVPPSSRADADG